jgi:uncharacterized protein
MTDTDAIIRKTADFVKAKFEAEGGGHDWWHMYRVWQLAKTIAKEEADADLFVVELGALLHDIADWKYHDGDTEAGPKAATEWLESQQVDQTVIEQVAYIIRYISFKGGTNVHKMKSLEGKIVQDADRLDAMGAIGIARTFAFGGHFNREMYDPKRGPKTFKSFEEVKANIASGTTVNHFYEKLLLLKDGMHTAAAKKLAQARHEYMEKFLEEFYAEWDGER